jgi:capsular polysaccharide export protein
MMRDAWSALRGKRILLLQGPVGPFFARLAVSLRALAADVHKVNFNGGDCLFYRSGVTVWRGPLHEWPKFFAALLAERQIDVVLLFGDCRPIHSLARQVALRAGVRIGAFEEGYVRPNFITFERYGVNGYSQIPRAPEFYRQLPRTAARPESKVGNTFWHSVLWSMLYYLASAIAHPWFRHYRHHRPLTLLEAVPWLRAAWRKAFYRVTERLMLGLLTGPLHKKFFLVPLQVSADSQVMQHSHFQSVGQFIEHVVGSFAAHASSDVSLVIKHHPLDRGYHDYSRLLRQLRLRLGLGGRLLYIHDQHLPTLFDNMCGAVVINSTVGFSALSHGAPLKTCGNALYDMEGLTFQGHMDQFWRNAVHARPDPALFERFRSYVIDRTQISGSFYRGAEAASLSVTAAAQRLEHLVDLTGLALDARMKA